MSGASMVALAVAAALLACLRGAQGYSYPLSAAPYSYPYPQPQWPPYYPYYPHPAYPVATVKPPAPRSPHRLPVVEFHKGDVIDYEYIYDSLPADYERKYIILKVDHKKPTTPRSAHDAAPTSEKEEAPPTEEPRGPSSEEPSSELPEEASTQEDRPYVTLSPPVFRPPSWERDDSESTTYPNYSYSGEQSTEDGVDSTADSLYD